MYLRKGAKVRPWSAHVTVSLGGHDTEEDAARAFDRAVQMWLPHRRIFNLLGGEPREEEEEKESEDEVGPSAQQPHMVDSKTGKSAPMRGILVMGGEASMALLSRC